MLCFHSIFIPYYVRENVDSDLVKVDLYKGNSENKGESRTKALNHCPVV